MTGSSKFCAHCSALAKYDFGGRARLCADCLQSILVRCEIASEAIPANSLSEAALAGPVIPIPGPATFPDLANLEIPEFLRVTA